MLTPEYLLRVSEGSEEIASELHTRILKKVIKRVMARKADGDDYMLTAIDKWQLDTLQEAGYLLEDIQQEISKYTGYQAKEVARAMEDAGITALKWDDKVYKQVGIDTPPLEQSPHMIRLMQREYEKTMGSWENFTGTTANATHQAFIDTMDEIHIEVMAGETGYIQAYQNAIDKLCDNGLTVTYPSGHTDTLETAALRCVRTGVAQATAEIQIERMNEEGQDLVLVSSHEGARPSHQEWQGKIYSRGANLDKYPDFVKSTHYGEGNGLCGWNCRHHFSPYIEGMKNPFEDYSNEENVKLYEETQEQRRQERNIRKTKRAIEGYKEEIDSLSPDDPMMEKAKERLKEQKNKLKRQNAEYKAYCKEKGFKELPERLRIAKARKAGDEYNLPDILDIKPTRRPLDIVPPTASVEPPKEQKIPKKEPADFSIQKEEPPVKAEKPAFEPQKPVNPPQEAERRPERPLEMPRQGRIPVENGELYEGVTGVDTAKLAAGLAPNAFGSERDTKKIIKLLEECEDKSLAKALLTWADFSSYMQDDIHPGASWFEPVENKVKWGKAPEGNSKNIYTIFAHEIGHQCDFHMDSIGNEDYKQRDAIAEAIIRAWPGGALSAPDRRPSQSDEFIRAMSIDMENLMNGNVVIDDTDKHLIYRHKDALGVSDFIDATCGGVVIEDGKIAMKDIKPNALGVKLTAGHGEKYWEKPYLKIMGQGGEGKVDEILEQMSKLGVNMSRAEFRDAMRKYRGAIELWANINRAILISKDAPLELHMLESYAPNAVRAFRKIVESHANALDEYARAGVKAYDIEKEPVEAADMKLSDRKKAIQKRNSIFEEIRKRFNENIKRYKETHG